MKALADHPGQTRWASSRYEDRHEGHESPPTRVGDDMLRLLRDVCKRCDFAPRFERF